MAHPERLSRFAALVREHRSANHPLFGELITLAEQGALSPTAYRTFASNVACRTMLTLPEICWSCVHAALDLDRTRTAFGVMTGGEEGGFGRPNEVHTVLMMDALNHHGRIVFGLEPIDLSTLMTATRLLHHSGQLLAAWRLSGGPSSEAAQQCREVGLFDCDGIAALCVRLAHNSGLERLPTSRLTPGHLAQFAAHARQVLSDQTVLPATVSYCLQQLRLLTDPRSGYVQGVGFAHEGLADGMLFNLFRIAHAGLGCYEGEDQFLRLTYPYFRAHGDYLAIVRGEHDGSAGVEAVHAQREYAKLEGLDDESLDDAWAGANDFADRNARVWDELHAAVTLRTTVCPTTLD